MKYLLAAIILLPFPAFAQATLQLLVANLILIVNDLIVPFLLGAAFVVFVYNVIKYFVYQSDSEDGREKARSLATYAVLAFVLIIMLWGTVNAIARSIGIFDYGCVNQNTSDYLIRNGLKSAQIQPCTNFNPSMLPAWMQRN
jgi:uncharacterized membrane protein